MNLALFLPNWVGDLVMATPAIRALRSHYGPAARIVGILRPNLADLLQGTDWLDQQWHFDPHSGHPDCGRRALVARMRQERFDLAVLLTNSFGTALMAWLGGARRRLGYARDLRGLLLTDRIRPPRNARGRWAPAPMVDAYLALAQAAGCPSQSQRLELALTETERSQGEWIWRALGLRTDGRVVALNSSGAYGTAKVWPIEHCAALARDIATRFDHDVLVLCGPKEYSNARAIVQQAAAPRVFVVPEPSVGLSTTKACLARCRLLVSTDSGPRHIAAALGTPVVTLLGPTLPVWIENPTVQGTMLLAAVDCLGCAKRTCPKGHHRCMRELLPGRVAEEVARMLIGSKGTVPFSRHDNAVEMGSPVCRENRDSPQGVRRAS